MPMTRMRLDKYLSKCGQGTRTEAKKLIRGGRVTVNAELVKDAGFVLDAASASVTVDDHLLRYRENHYLMLNKPQGVISATRDRVQPTVLDFLPPEYRHLDLFPIGRLDKDTEGLVVLTDDGPLTHRLLSPKKQVPKTYLARVKGTVTPSDAEHFAAGIELEDFTTLPAHLEILAAGPQSAVRVTICEGKFHQVKRMFHALGKEVLHLQRISLGGLELDPHLEPGNVRELTVEELALLQKWR